MAAADIKAARKAQITDLLNQWNVMVGYSVDIPDWMVDEMASNMHYVDGHAITTLYDVGRYMSFHITSDTKTDGSHPITGNMAGEMPWAFFGLSSTEYQSRFQSFQETYQGLTGENLAASDFHNYLWGSGGAMTSSEFRTKLLNDKNMRKTYGWLQYGLDYNQFQQRKQEFQQLFGFGTEMTNAQAVLQLQYSHQATADHSAQVVPTLSQQEKKAADVGTSFSQVR